MTSSASTKTAFDWRDRVLDFFAIRGPAIFGYGTTTGSAGLARALARVSWESLVTINTLSSPDFQSLVSYTKLHASREIQHVREAVRRSTRWTPRGRILARETVKARLRHLDPHLWVAELSRRHFELEENAAIVAFCSYLLDSVDNLPETHRGLCVATLSDLRLILKTHPLREVRLGSDWKLATFSPHLQMSSKIYRGFAKYIDATRLALSEHNSARIQNVVKGWLKAADEDKLFEAYVLSELAEAILSLGPWSALKISGQLGYSSSIEARRPDLAISVIIDRALRAASSVYQTILESYSVGASSRRPDVQLIVSSNGRSSSCLIDAKNVELESAYGRESIYKMLGYLRDAGVARGIALHPPGVLVYSGDVPARYPLSERMNRDEILLVQVDETRPAFQALIAAMIATNRTAA